ncbi:MAG: collagen-like protein [Pseudomonadota bacterium]
MLKRNLMVVALGAAVFTGLTGCVDDGDDGAPGPQGAQGAQGPQGAEGPQGAQGPAGQDAAPYVHTGPFFADNSQIVSDPMLTGPAEGEVSVVWYTTFEGAANSVVFGDRLDQSVVATTTRMSQMFEDEGSELPFNRSVGQALPGEAVVEQTIYRHEARVTGLAANQRVPYFAVSTVNGADFKSQIFTLQPLPAPDQPVKLLITSDQQNRAMSPANFQKVVETVGQVDAVLFAGDLVSTPNRASEWFYSGRENFPPFFPSLQGTYDRIAPNYGYRGGAILQHAPVFATIGNHESPGIFDRTRSLGAQDNGPQPRWYAEHRWDRLTDAERQATGLTREEWVRRNSYDHVTYYEMWNLPENQVAGEDPENFYSVRYGNVSLISMNVSRVWRNWNNGLTDTNTNPGKFGEPIPTVNDLDTWGFGDMFFADYSPGSAQRQWLGEQLASTEVQDAPFQVVLTHQSMHGYGDNVVPVMANPEATIDFTDGTPTVVTTFPADDATWATIVAAAERGAIERVRYDYEREDDLWLGVESELLAADVDLVVSGHSHVWSRTFVEDADSRLNYLETSNVGNSFGPFAGPNNRVRWARNFYPDPDTNDTRDNAFWDPADYPRVGDSQGRPDVLPSELTNGVDFMRQVEEATADLPYLSSNKFTVFTILDSGEGTVKSYAHEFDFPANPARLVDCFPLDASASPNPC